MTTPRMLNWLCRYAVATSALLDESRALTTSLLDVGSGPHGFACAHPDTPFVGIDTLFPLAPAPSMLAVRNAPGRLPFADGAFGAVISLDVLEHVPPSERSGFVSEMARVSAGQAIVACPSSEMAPVDDLLRTTFLRSGLPVPVWLSEHDEHGLPTPAEIAAHCAAPEGFRSRAVPVPNGTLSTMASLADFTPETADAAVADATRDTARWLQLFEDAVFGESWRKAYVIERQESLTPIVDQANLDLTVTAAFRCSRCEQPVEQLTPRLLRCVACQHLVARDRLGIWDLRPGPTQLWCEPEWRGDALAPLLRGFADLDHPAATLVLRARPGVIDAPAALACATAALGDRELASHVDVEILADSLSPVEEAARTSAAVMVDADLFVGLRARAGAGAS